MAGRTRRCRPTAAYVVVPSHSAQRGPRRLSLAVTARPTFPAPKRTRPAPHAASVTRRTLAMYSLFTESPPFIVVADESLINVMAG